MSQINTTPYDNSDEIILKYPHVLAPSIRNLIEKINVIMNGNESNKSSLLGDLMKNFPIRNRDLKKYAFIEESAPYTRNLIYETENYALILMCWKPRTDSVIHTHGGSSCWARIVNGEVQEYRYVFNENDDEPKKIGETLLDIGQVTYIDDLQGLHSLSNPSNAYSMSLHLYSPPIRTAKYFDASDREMHMCEMKYHRKHNTTST